MRKMANVGGVLIGGGNPIVVQSMTNTDTNDVAATVAQTMRMVEAGCQLVRITVPTMREVEALQQIKERLRAEGCAVPLVADVHYRPEVAEACAAIVEKVRINPGNYVDKRRFEHLEMSEEEYAASVQAMADRAHPLFDICKQHGTALRIGVNHGSLCDRIVSRYGNTPLAMAMSALEWMDICQQTDFQNIVFSLKSSNVLTMIEATRLLHEKMLERETLYPLHLGVTEAGAGDEGRIKSAAGIGALLLDGIGDTVRVSLTEAPEKEVSPALLLANVQALAAQVRSRHDGETLTLECDEPDRQRWMIATAAFAGHELIHHPYKKLTINNIHFPTEERENVADMILQACRIKMTRTEIVSCPSCGRTQYDIQGTLAKVKARFNGYPDLKLGVMGCIVNGPGEMADADFGIVGASAGKVCVYRQKERLTAPLEVDEALSKLEALIRDFRR
jgi:(E)-4-hydroxy-3-methylbut-2-enyl-diphosphate synthase